MFKKFLTISDSPDTLSDDSIDDPTSEHLINITDDPQLAKFELSNVTCENSHVTTYKPDAMMIVTGINYLIPLPIQVHLYLKMPILP